MTTPKRDKPIRRAPPRDELAVTIGARARVARERAKLTQADVAEQIGIDREVYGRMERGIMRPSVVTLRKLSMALGFSTDVLLGLQKDTGSSIRPTMRGGVPPELRGIIRRARSLKPRERWLVTRIVSALVDKPRK